MIPTLNKLAPNFTELRLGQLTIWFSYSTSIAFRYTEHPVQARHNEWGPTTGKHLNTLCPDKSKRLDGRSFEDCLNNTLIQMGADL